MRGLPKNVLLCKEGAILLKEQTAILGDLHIGYEEQNPHLLIGKQQLPLLCEVIDSLFSAAHVTTVVLNGDILHEFGRLRKSSMASLGKFLAHIQTYIPKSNIIFIKGNHDTMTPIAAREFDIDMREYLIVGDTLICHGDKLFSALLPKVKTILIGHEHPAIELADGIRTETYKCFMAGKYKNKNLIVLPSANPLTIGTDVLLRGSHSPYITTTKFTRYVALDTGEILKF